MKKLYIFIYTVVLSLFFASQVFSQTWPISRQIKCDNDLRIFGGKEKGGKVCRNGICRYQSEFEGVRVEITTSF